MIEAKWLFGVDPSRIEVLVHPQSIVHSMVQFRDTSIIAQLGQPDMRVPIQYAFSYPERLKLNLPPIDFFELSQLTFEKPDRERFPNLEYAYEAVEVGGNMPCILNAANEVAVDLFLQERIGFGQMSQLIEKTLQKASFIQAPTLEDYVESDAETREIANKFIN